MTDVVMAPGAGQPNPGFKIQSLGTAHPLRAEVAPYFDRCSPDALPVQVAALRALIGPWRPSSDLPDLTPAQISLLTVNYDALRAPVVDGEIPNPARFQRQVLRETVAQIYKTHGLDGAIEFATATILSLCDNSAAAQGEVAAATFPDADRYACLCVIDEISLSLRRDESRSGVNMAQAMETALLDVLRAKERSTFTRFCGSFLANFAALPDAISKLAKQFPDVREVRKETRISPKDGALRSSLSEQLKSLNFQDPVAWLSSKFSSGGTSFIDPYFCESGEKLNCGARRLDFVTALLGPLRGSGLTLIAVQGYQFELLNGLADALVTVNRDISIFDITGPLAEMMSLPHARSPRTFSDAFRFSMSDLTKSGQELVGAVDRFTAALRETKIRCALVPTQLGDHYKGTLDTGVKCLFIGNAGHAALKSHAQSGLDFVRHPTFMLTTYRLHPPSGEQFVVRKSIPAAASRAITEMEQTKWGKGRAVAVDASKLRNEMTRRSELRGVFHDGEDFSHPLYSGMVVCSVDPGQDDESGGYTEGNRVYDPSGGLLSGT